MSVLRRIGNYFFILVLCVFIFQAHPTAVSALANNYPRLANYFLRLDRLQDYHTLARYDVVVLPAETMIFQPNLAWQLRSVNPDIVILAYVPSQSFHRLWNNSLHNSMRLGIHDSWWLRDQSGNQIYLTPDLRMLNVASGWADYVAEYTVRDILSNPFWNGVFYDMVDDSISWLNNGNVDLNRDGRRDDSRIADQQWLQGMARIMYRTRQLKSDAIVVINGSSHSVLQSNINGRLFENFPTPWHKDGSWQASEQDYINAHDDPRYQPPLFILNTDTQASRGELDFSRMRFGLASALLGNGYFSFDKGAVDHGQLWWFDEYDVKLGSPLNGPVDIDHSLGNVRSGVWQREFEHGLVVVNSSNQRQRVQLDQEYEKIRGTQDPLENDGTVIDRLFMEPFSGIILKKRQDDILGSSFMNGSFVRVFDERGNTQQAGFFSYKNTLPSSSTLQIRDINRDGFFETVVATHNAIEIYANTGRRLVRFYPYTSRYQGEINFTIEDINGDGTQEIITGTSLGYGPHLRVFNSRGKLINPGFFAYNKGFRGGVSVALCDTNGNHLQEVVTGAGPHGGAHIRIFTSGGRVLSPGFFAYPPTYRGGVRVACGDLNGDGIDEIITSKMTGAPEIKIFSHKGEQLTKSFQPFLQGSGADVYVSTLDLNRDGKEEILVQTLKYF